MERYDEKSKHTLNNWISQAHLNWLNLHDSKR